MITRQTAINSYLGQTFYHVELKNSDGTALRGRVNGKCRLWKTRLDEFRLPMKHGLFECFYIDQANADEWSAVDAAS